MKQAGIQNEASYCWNLTVEVEAARESTQQPNALQARTYRVRVLVLMLVLVLVLVLPLRVI
jgi:hypothetical protein